MKHVSVRIYLVKCDLFFATVCALHVSVLGSNDMLTFKHIPLLMTNMDYRTCVSLRKSEKRREEKVGCVGVESFKWISKMKKTRPWI